MKNLSLIKKYLFIVNLLIASIGNNYSQCFERIGDYAGILDEKTSLLNEWSCTNKAELPVEFQNQFKIFEYIHYVHDESMGELENQTEYSKVQASSLSSYYLLINKAISPKGSVVFIISLKLPSTGVFSCANSNEQLFIQSRIQAEFNKANSIANLEFVYHSGLKILSNYIKKVKECCLPGFRSSCNICGEAQQFTKDMEVMHFAKFKLEDINESDLQRVLLLGTSGKTARFKTITSNQVCNGTKSIETELASLNSFNFSGLIVTTDIGEAFLKLGIPCVFGINLNQTILELPISEVKVELEFISLKLLYPNENIHWLYIKAYYNICVSAPVHTALFGAGLVFDAADLFDGAIYLLEGNSHEAKWSFIGSVPLIGSELKAIKKLEKVSEAGQNTMVYIIRSGNKIVVKPLMQAGSKLIELGSKFGNLAVKKGFARHHIIPWELLKEYATFNSIKRLLTKSNLTAGDPRNLVYLATKVGEDSWHKGAHPAYTESIRKYLEKLSINFVDDQKYFDEVAKMMDEVQDELETLAQVMEKNPGKYGSLNDVWKYARDFVKWP